MQNEGTMRTLLVLTATLLTGCSVSVDRYTWTGGDSSRFELNRQECLREANAAYVPFSPGCVNREASSGAQKEDHPSAGCG
jgi:hypothetical protein